MTCGGDFEREGEDDGEGGHREHGSDAEEGDVSEAGQGRVDRGQQEDHHSCASGESVDDSDGEGFDAEDGFAQEEEAVVVFAVGFVLGLT